MNTYKCTHVASLVCVKVVCLLEVIPAKMRRVVHIHILELECEQRSSRLGLLVGYTVGKTRRVNST